MSHGIYWSEKDIPERYRAQVERQLHPFKPDEREMEKADREASRWNRKLAPIVQAMTEVHIMEHPECLAVPDKTRTRIRTRSIGGPRQPNRTERRFNAEVLEGHGRYEAITLHLPGGSRYTPDWMVYHGGDIVLYEVKGSYRFHSEGRAHTAFQEARAAFPMFKFKWAVLKRDGTWEFRA